MLNYIEPKKYDLAIDVVKYSRDADSGLESVSVVLCNTAGDDATIVMNRLLLPPSSNMSINPVSIVAMESDLIRVTKKLPLFKSDVKIAYKSLSRLEKSVESDLLNRILRRVS